MRAAGQGLAFPLDNGHDIDSAEGLYVHNKIHDTRTIPSPSSISLSFSSLILSVNSMTHSSTLILPNSSSSTPTLLRPTNPSFPPLDKFQSIPSSFCSSTYPYPSSQPRSIRKVHLFIFTPYTSHLLVQAQNPYHSPSRPSGYTIVLLLPISRNVGALSI